MATGKAYSITVPQDVGFVTINKVGGNSVAVNGEIISAELQSISSKKSDSSLIDSLPIPAALLSFVADKGYGWAAGSKYNGFDFNRKVYRQEVARYNFVENSPVKAYSDADNVAWRFELGRPIYQSANLLMSIYTLTTTATNVRSMPDKSYGGANNTTYIDWIYVRDDDYKSYTPSQVQEALADAYLYYELETPVEYDISDYLPNNFRNKLRVQSGGSLTFIQQIGGMNLSVPYDIDWASYIPYEFDYTTVTLTNGIFDHWNITHDVSSAYSPTIPTEWTTQTIMNADFNGNIQAGNISEILSNIDGFRIKRRRIDEFDWLTIKYIPVRDVTELSFLYNDNLAVSGEEYEYAVVPVIGVTEGDYITSTITAKFNGVFIADADYVYRFLAGVNYGETIRNQKVGVFEPYGRKYPVIVSNGEINYDTGSISGTVLNNDYLITHELDKTAIRKEAKILVDFLTNKKAKIIKDWNGKIWLVAFTGNPQTSYADGSGMGLLNVSAEWTEIGDADNQADLLATGIVKEVG